MDIKKLCVSLRQNSTQGRGETEHNKTSNTMKAEITMSQLWNNPTILGFFFTEQAQNTLAELLNKAEDRETALEQIDSIADSWDMDADAVGDMFHDMSVEELAKEFEIDLTEEETEKETEEEETELYSIWVGAGEITDNYIRDYNKAVELAKVWRDEKGHKDTCIEVVNEDGNHKRFIAEF